MSELETVGILRSPFRQKFGVPRQPGLVRGLHCTLEVAPAYDPTESTQILAAQLLLNFIGFIFHERDAES